MALPEPRFESRTYRDLYNEAIARIPAHTPEWTNRAEPDPGITLLQLFSYMTESLLYRTNLIPERNRQKFLRLLQIPMRAAAAAEGLVAFSNPRGPGRGQCAVSQHQRFGSITRRIADLLQKTDARGRKFGTGRTLPEFIRRLRPA